MDLSRYGVRAVVKRFPDLTVEFTTKMNPESKPSQKLTANNSTFGHSYKQARSFEKQLMDCLKRGTSKPDR